MHRVIAVDGPAASGKSSVSKRVAQKLGFAFVSSGLMYRTFTWVVCQAGIDAEDETAVLALLEKTELSPDRRGYEMFIRANGEDPGDAVTSDEVNANVSKIAKLQDVRKALVCQQRACSEAMDLVMEGRDICSVVFPNTPYKFYLDASEEVRAQRRAAQGLKDSIAERDKMDSTRKASPLKIDEGATVVDTSDLTLDEVVETILGHLKDQGLAEAQEC